MPSGEGGADADAPTAKPGPSKCHVWALKGGCLPDMVQHYCVCLPIAFSPRTCLDRKSLFFPLMLLWERGPLGMDGWRGCACGLPWEHSVRLVH